MNLKTIENSLAVFCLATYGEGDPTDNAMEFFEWLKTGEADLNGLNYAVSHFSLRYCSRLPQDLHYQMIYFSLLLLLFINFPSIYNI